MKGTYVSFIHYTREHGIAHDLTAHLRSFSVGALTARELAGSGCTAWAGSRFATIFDATKLWIGNLPHATSAASLQGALRAKFGATGILWCRMINRQPRLGLDLTRSTCSVVAFDTAAEAAACRDAATSQTLFDDSVELVVRFAKKEGRDKSRSPGRRPDEVVYAGSVSSSTLPRQPSTWPPYVRSEIAKMKEELQVEAMGLQSEFHEEAEELKAENTQYWQEAHDASTSRSEVLDELWSSEEWTGELRNAYDELRHQSEQAVQGWSNEAHSLERNWHDALAANQAWMANAAEWKKRFDESAIESRNLHTSLSRTEMGCRSLQETISRQMQSMKQMSEVYEQNVEMTSAT